MFSSMRKQAALAEARVRRGRESTYTEPLRDKSKSLTEAELEALKEFISNFYRTIYKRRDECAAICKANPRTVGHYFQILVPRKVSFEDFWQRYFYRCDADRILADWDTQEHKRKEQREEALRETVQRAQNMWSSVTTAATVAKEEAAEPIPMQEDEPDDVDAFLDADVFARHRQEALDVLKIAIPNSSTLTTDSKDIYGGVAVPKGNVDNISRQAMNIDANFEAIMLDTSLSKQKPASPGILNLKYDTKSSSSPELPVQTDRTTNTDDPGADVDTASAKSQLTTAELISATSAQTPIDVEKGTHDNMNMHSLFGFGTAAQQAPEEKLLAKTTSNTMKDPASLSTELDGKQGERLKPAEKTARFEARKIPQKVDDTEKAPKTDQKAKAGVGTSEEDRATETGSADKRRVTSDVSTTPEVSAPKEIAEIDTAKMTKSVPIATPKEPSAAATAKGSTLSWQDIKLERITAEAKPITSGVASEMEDQPRAAASKPVESIAVKADSGRKEEVAEIKNSESIVTEKMHSTAMSGEKNVVVVEKPVASLRVLAGSPKTAKSTKRSTTDSNIVTEKSSSEVNAKSLQNRRAFPGSMVEAGEPLKKNIDPTVQGTAATLPTKKNQEARVPHAKSFSSTKRVSFNPKREEIKASPDRMEPSTKLDRLRGNSHGGASVRNLKSFWNEQNQPTRTKIETQSKASESVRHRAQDEGKNISGKVSGKRASSSQPEAASREHIPTAQIVHPVTSAIVDLKDTPYFPNSIIWAIAVVVAMLGVTLTVIFSQQSYLCAPFLGSLIVGQFEAPHWAPPKFKSIAFDTVCLSSTKTKLSWTESKRGFTLEIEDGDNILLRRERLARGHIDKNKILLTSTKLVQEELVSPWKRA